MKHIALFIITFMLSSILYAQAPVIGWMRTYGGSSSEWGTFVQQADDGGFIISGTTSSFGEGLSDFWLVRTDLNGDSLWSKSYGGTNFDWSSVVYQTSDGGFIILGNTESFGAGLSDIWLLKTNSVGDTLWTKTYGGSEYDFSGSLALTMDGGYIFTGGTSSQGAGEEDVWIIKTDESGDTLWTKTYGGAMWERGMSIKPTNDGGYVILAITGYSVADTLDLWLLKIDTFGDTLWTKTYSKNHFDVGYDVEQTSDGGFIMTGGTIPPIGEHETNVLLIRTDASGDTLWTKTFGGSREDLGRSVKQTSDGEFLITGSTRSFDPGVWLIKTNSSGDSLWTRNYGGNNGDWGSSASFTADGGFVIAGGTWSFGTGGADVLLIKLNSITTNISDENYSIANSYDLKQNYPNPFNPVTLIEYTLPVASEVRLAVYNLKGKLIFILINRSQPAGFYNIEWDASEYASGIYFYRLSADNFVETKKMLLLK